MQAYGVIIDKDMLLNVLHICSAYRD
ncbi:DUF1705 domain-containing protein [Campylobacter concisus]|nr:DUF1705 domain-containing protein [Campylobacter concisus]